MEVDRQCQAAASCERATLNLPERTESMVWAEDLKSGLLPPVGSALSTTHASKERIDSALLRSCPEDSFGRVSLNRRKFDNITTAGLRLMIGGS